MGMITELEDDIADTRRELDLCKKEVQILNTEKETVSEMSEAKQADVYDYVMKEFNYIEDLVNKAQTK
eukprot:CAMPEP_0170495564 /NCGR_PEP_ID=MMETSP0208-20121228/17280_1 /TAXON_ID=197538 /ORGANISM="Strombidium inclinatum, Strain S3" /LENGTH=67 /DNA_ID=CAMNT_0010771847 /DNA_START=184 /DNA_END=387 /DNA_ORIENTATION=-